ncbi:MAG: AmmeMemoRadiSam system protein B [Nitrospiraceae bacterium]|nr:MAG: AmmeMemoRadiSam system protein B [Nitrospiraceae bacterium]
MKRSASVAGQFYESSPERLCRQVSGFVDKDARKIKALGVVAPHAGLMYSGGVAGAVYSRIETPGTFIMLGPNHTGLGRPVSLMSEGVWEVPTGSLAIDERLAGKLKAHSPEIAGIVAEDSLAHQLEHSLEVQLPFILHFSPEVKILPIAMMSLPLETCRIVGEALADIAEDSPYPVTIVASSDMSHYESDARARKKDRRAIERILALDPEGLYRTVKEEGISMCGVVPATTMLFAAVKQGAGEASLVKYMTSGEVSGDYDYVVGYAGIIIS